jgi:hypothetical protein
MRLSNIANCAASSMPRPCRLCGIESICRSRRQIGPRPRRDVVRRPPSTRREGMAPGCSQATEDAYRRLWIARGTARRVLGHHKPEDVVAAQGHSRARHRAGFTLVERPRSSPRRPSSGPNTIQYGGRGHARFESVIGRLAARGTAGNSSTRPPASRISRRAAREVHDLATAWGLGLSGANASREFVTFTRARARRDDSRLEAL